MHAGPLVLCVAGRGGVYALVAIGEGGWAARLPVAIWAKDDSDLLEIRGRASTLSVYSF